MSPRHRPVGLSQALESNMGGVIIGAEGPAFTVYGEADYDPVLESLFEQLERDLGELVDHVGLDESGEKARIVAEGVNVARQTAAHLKGTDPVQATGSLKKAKRDGKKVVKELERIEKQGEKAAPEWVAAGRSLISKVTATFNAIFRAVMRGVRWATWPLVSAGRFVGGILKTLLPSPAPGEKWWQTAIRYLGTTAWEGVMAVGSFYAGKFAAELVLKKLGAAAVLKGAGVATGTAATGGGALAFWISLGLVAPLSGFVKVKMAELEDIAAAFCQSARTMEVEMQKYDVKPDISFLPGTTLEEFGVWACRFSIFDRWGKVQRRIKDIKARGAEFRKQFRGQVRQAKREKMIQFVKDNDLLSQPRELKDFADMAGVKVGTIKRWVREGPVPKRQPRKTRESSDVDAGLLIDEILEQNYRDEDPCCDSCRDGRGCEGCEEAGEADSPHGRRS